jgi:hypothetical protein
MTMKSTLIAPMTLLAALAAGVLVHDGLGIKSHVDDAVPPQTVSVATAEPVAPAPASPPSASAAPPLPQEASLVDDGAPTRTASIGTAGPATLTLPPFSAAPSGLPEILPSPRMTASQEASLNTWMIKTYLGCWKPATQPSGTDHYVVRVRLIFKPDGSLQSPPKLVNPPSNPAQKPQAKGVLQAVKACDPLSIPAQYRSFYQQWKTKTIFFDPQVAAR